MKRAAVKPRLFVFSNANLLVRGNNDPDGRGPLAINSRNSASSSSTSIADLALKAQSRIALVPWMNTRLRLMDGRTSSFL
jgi:hypothetical protein